MTTEDVVMLIDKPHLIVKLHKRLLEVDFKKGMRKELEDVLEAKPKLRQSLGFLFQTVIPLDVAIKDIESVKVDKNGQVKIVIPSRRDITIPLTEEESRNFVSKLKELMAIEKREAAEDVVMVVKKPNFTVKLRKTLLEVDLIEGVKKELEDIFEAKPILRNSLGLIFQSAVPLDVPLKDIETATLNKKGQVKIEIPHRKDIIIPLEAKESNRLIDKLNELIPIEKAREIERILASERAKAERALEKAEAELEAERRLRLPR